MRDSNHMKYINAVTKINEQVDHQVDKKKLTDIYNRFHDSENTIERYLESIPQYRAINTATKYLQYLAEENYYDSKRILPSFEEKLQKARDTIIPAINKNLQKIIYEEEEKRKEKAKNAQIEKLYNKINQLNSDTLQGEGSEIKKQIKEKEDYLKTLGLFKGKEKGAARKDIEQLKGKLQARKKELMDEVFGLCGLNGKVGDKVEFGNSLSESNKKIEWQILDVQGNKKLLIAKRLVDERPYNTELKTVTWETCTLRKWLNNEFYNNAFSDIEKGLITETVTKADPNPKYKTNPGRDTRDRVILLSIKEAEQYFKTGAKGKCDGKWWWLRSPGCDNDHAAYMDIDGSVNAFGINVNVKSSVRPALWINTEAF